MWIWLELCQVHSSTCHRQHGLTIQHLLGTCRHETCSLRPHRRSQSAQQKCQIARGKARHLWCGWSEWLRMVGKNQEPGPSLWLSNRCFIQIYHNIFDWLKRSSAPMKTCWNMLKPVETANMCISSINTQSIYKQSLKNNNCARVANERKRPCARWVRHVWGFATTLGLRCLRESSPSISPHDPQSAASPECALGYGRKQEFIWCQHLCIRVFKVATSSQPNLAPIHLEHLGTSWNILEHLGIEPATLFESCGVQEWSHVSKWAHNVSSAGAIGCCRML